jgi:excisionase family DNA binding protein
MHEQATTSAAPPSGIPEIPPPSGWRAVLRSAVLSTALRKREAGVPTYSVAEAAALLSVSAEHLYRLVRAGKFPALQMADGAKARWIIPAKAVEKLLDDATAALGVLDVADWTQAWRAGVVATGAGVAR